MLKIETMKVLEITEEDVKVLKRNDSPLMTCGYLEAEADIIICKGRVLKNKYGEKLLACPFCGSPAAHESTVTQETVRCTLCPATMSHDGSGAAIKAMWNSRANSEGHGRAVARTVHPLVVHSELEDK